MPLEFIIVMSNVEYNVCDNQENFLTLKKFCNFKKMFMAFSKNVYHVFNKKLIVKNTNKDKKNDRL